MSCRKTWPQGCFHFLVNSPSSRRIGDSKVFLQSFIYLYSSLTESQNESASTRILKYGIPEYISTQRACSLKIEVIRQENKAMLILERLPNTILRAWLSVCVSWWKVEAEKEMFSWCVNVHCTVCSVKTTRPIPTSIFSSYNDHHQPSLARGEFFQSFYACAQYLTSVYSTWACP